MKKSFSYLALIASLLLTCSSQVSAYPDDITPTGLNTKTGQLFNIKIIPAKKQIDIYVVGNEMAKVDLSQMNMLATITVGKKQWVVAPKKVKDHYAVQIPQDFPAQSPSELRLNIQHQGKKEDFKFNMGPSN